MPEKHALIPEISNLCEKLSSVSRNDVAEFDESDQKRIFSAVGSMQRLIADTFATKSADYYCAEYFNDMDSYSDMSFSSRLMSARLALASYKSSRQGIAPPNAGCSFEIPVKFSIDANGDIDFGLEGSYLSLPRKRSSGGLVISSKSDETPLQRSPGGTDILIVNRCAIAHAEGDVPALCRTALANHPQLFAAAGRHMAPVSDLENALNYDWYETKGVIAAPAPFLDQNDIPVEIVIASASTANLWLERGDGIGKSIHDAIASYCDSRGIAYNSDKPHGKPETDNAPKATVPGAETERVGIAMRFMTQNDAPLVLKIARMDDWVAKRSSFPILFSVYDERNGFEVCCEKVLYRGWYDILARRDEIAERIAESCEHAFEERYGEQTGFSIGTYIDEMIAVALDQMIFAGKMRFRKDLFKDVKVLER